MRRMGRTLLMMVVWMMAAGCCLARPGATGAGSEMAPGGYGGRPGTPGSRLARGPAWAPLLEDLCRAEEPVAVEAALARVLAAGPSCADLRRALGDLPFPHLARGTFHAFTWRARDDRERPWLLYVPAGYHPRRATPLLVVLHGGVSGEEVGPAQLQKDAEADPFFRLAREQGWLMLYPLGQDGATWWDDIGHDAVLGQIRRVKRMANVDDDRVWLAGFSDGAGGALALAMLHPGEFGAVVACNGHPALGNLDGDLPLRLPMLANVPCYLVNTDADEFFPVEKMRPLVETAARAGADLVWRELPGRHRFAGEPAELARVAAFLERHPRDPLAPRVICETERPVWGRCRWLAIDEIVPGPAAPWAEDFNPIVRDESVNFHFIGDQRYRGTGVRAQRVFPDSLAARLGMRTGDVLVRLDGRPIRNPDDLAAVKRGLRAGRELTLTVRRDGTDRELTGRLPDPTLAWVFARQSPAGTVRARLVGNRFHLETSRVGRVSLRLSADLVDLAAPVEVTVNGRGVFRDRVDPDPAFLLRGYLADRDRKMLFDAGITLEDLW